MAYLEGSAGTGPVLIVLYFEFGLLPIQVYSIGTPYRPTFVRPFSTPAYGTVDIRDTDSGFTSHNLDLMNENGYYNRIQV